jgi:hypothetical protein
MRRQRLAVVLIAGLVSSACYHQVVQTGKPAGSTVIERPWTSTFIFGLVAASEINTASQCPNGVATVETQQSFLNGLVGVLTFGLYTPLTVTITCAGAAPLPEVPEIEVPAGAGADEMISATNEAIELARRTGGKVAIRYSR